MNITKLQTILAAIVCALAAGAIYLWVPALQGNVAPGLAGLALLLIGWAKQHPADAGSATPEKPMAEVVDLPTAKLPKPGPAGPVALLILAGAMLLASPARAQTPQAIGCFDAANTWCVVPAAAAGWQINLKTGSVSNGVGLAGLVLQHELGTIPLGLGLYGGLGASTQNQTSYQGCVGASVTNFGLLCIGAQRASFSDGSTAWQGMLTFAGQLVFGGTPAYVQKTATEATKAASVGKAAGDG